MYTEVFQKNAQWFWTQRFVDYSHNDEVASGGPFETRFNAMENAVEVAGQVPIDTTDFDPELDAII